MPFFKSATEDVRFLKERFLVNPLLAVLTNRGFHALLIYRIANKLFKYRVPLIPLILTRMIQILYAIDIDYKASLSGGIIIIHGVGLVIGQGVIIDSAVILYHGVTLGRRKQTWELNNDDGYPTILNGCTIGAGAKLIGKITIGSNTIIGPNAVVTESIDADSIVKAPKPLVIKKLYR